MVLLLILSWLWAGPAVQDIPVPGDPSSPPLVAVYTAGRLPVEDAMVVVTNPSGDRALLLRACEFPGQLPETRYFYHGRYGQIVKDGNNYIYSGMPQQLSRPLGTCLLLPGQSAGWRRPVRTTGRRLPAVIEWQTIPLTGPPAIWFHERPLDALTDLFIPLTPAWQDRYRNRTVAGGTPPAVVVEGDFPLHRAEMTLDCLDGKGLPWPDRPAEDIRLSGVAGFSLEPVAARVVITGETVFFSRPAPAGEPAEPVPVAMDPAAADLLFLCSRRPEQTVPCLLDPPLGDGLIEVKSPRSERFYDPGITEVPLAVLARILERAWQRGLAVRLRCIDPDSLGKQNVLAIGREVDARGRPVPVPEKHSTR